MESVLQSAASKNATAIFCHADVTGASMNDLIVSQGGVLPRYFLLTFPSIQDTFINRTLYGNRRSVSSTSDRLTERVLSEAHQDKQLLVLDSTQGWTTIERVSP
jgi:hypothetical protein